MKLMDVTLVTLMAIPVILGAVNLLKSWGLPSKVAPLAAVILAVAISIVEFFYQSQALYQSIANAIIMTFGAMGLYDGLKLAGGPAPQVNPDNYTIDPALFGEGGPDILWSGVVDPDERERLLKATETLPARAMPDEGSG